MAETLRLDKLLANMGAGSRKDVRGFIKKGLVAVNDQPCFAPERLINPQKDAVTFRGKPFIYEKYTYLMMNKPAGYVSANEDGKDATVMELLPEPYNQMNLFVAGRLDKDTEGLLILTNNGKFAHNMLSPKKHVPKTYYAQIKGVVTDRDKAACQNGITLDDGYQCQPAVLDILEAKPISQIHLTISEGKFHQVKRMFEALGHQVLYLKRIQIGQLPLDTKLPLGEVKKLTAEDLALIGAELDEA